MARTFEIILLQCDCDGKNMIVEAALGQSGPGQCCGTKPPA